VVGTQAIRRERRPVFPSPSCAFCFRHPCLDGGWGSRLEGGVDLGSVMVHAVGGMVGSTICIVWTLTEERKRAGLAVKWS